MTTGRNSRSPNVSFRPCACGSRLEKRPLFDSARSFLTYVCDKCEKEKRAGFNPAVFTSTQYAITGKEEALEIDDQYDD